MKVSEGWDVLRLDQIAEVLRGVTYKKSDARSSPQAGYIPLLRATNIGAGLDLSGEMVYVPVGNVKPEQRLHLGDIVLASSSGSLSVVGKNAPLHVPWEGTFGAFCAVIRPHGVDSRYLSYYLSSESVRRRWSEAARGTNINNLKRSDLQATLVPVPSLAEQRTIVEHLEDHLSRLDAADSGLRVALKRTETLLTAGLWNATHGLDATKTVQLQEIGEVRLGRQRSPKNHHGDRMRPYLRAANVGWDELRLEDVKTMQFSEQEERTYRLEDGDILLTEASGSAAEVGKSAVYRGLPADVCFQNTLLRVRCHSADPEFVQKYLLAEARAGRFMPESRGVGINHLGRARLAALSVELPSQPHQAVAIAESRALIDNVERIQAAIRVQQRRSAQLRRSVLAAAFLGMLTALRDQEVIEELTHA